MFKHSLLASVALAALVSSAHAADWQNANALATPLPTKAPAFAVLTKAPCDLTGCTGPTLGAQVSGSGTGVNVLNLGSLNAGGTFMGGNAGYQMYNGVYWLAVKAEVEYDVASPPSAIVGGAFSNKLFAFEGIEFGGVIANMFGIAPLNLPGWLAGAVPTILVGACQHGSLTGYCAGAAAHFFIPNSRWTIDAQYLNAQYSGGTQLSPTVSANTENKGTMGFSYHF